ncbi:hypothetical protein [Curtobacterium sp. MCBD17_030]|uniref:hypothetical protein n=1 Tax=Curtobacterium sp. MCBD17_030 TaxID=2175649 RepID=UPI000D93F11F|nr:hypothetical protein [Curtobacterium sp. MCBD17_030]PYY32269.1 hypothetical protein DEI89_13665 [Curtobacterium sp. MCBD17_030]
MLTLNRTPRLPLIAVAAAAVVVLLLLTLTGCSSSTDKYAGSYVGSSGATTLLLSSDSTAAYTQGHPGTQRSDDTATTTWELKDGVITVKENDVLDYDIVAKVDPNSTSLLFQGPDSSSWTDEIFTKTATS